MALEIRIEDLRRDQNNTDSELKDRQAKKTALEKRRTYLENKEKYILSQSARTQQLEDQLKTQVKETEDHGHV